MARGKKSSPAWSWLLTGMLIGLFAAFLLYLNDSRTGVPRAHHRQGQNAATASANAGNEGKHGAKFDFYTILPDLEIPVPDIKEILPGKHGSDGHSGSTQPPGNGSNTTAPQNVNPQQFVLQVGAFRSHDEADRLKASLALQGITAHIESSDINGTTWHRVRVGPFSSMGELNDTNNKLKSKGINAMLLKLKG